MSLEEILNVQEIWCINLDRRPERWKHVENQFRIHHIDSHLQRFPAVDAKQLSTSTLKSLVHPDGYPGIFQNQRRYHEELPLGAVGCYLSHVELWKYAVEKQISIGVMEDDIIFQDQFMSKLRQIQFPPEYDMIQFHTELIDEPWEIFPDYIRLHKFYYSTFYVITPNGAEILLRNIFPMQFQVDIYIAIHTPLMKIYAIQPDLVTQANYPSDNQDWNQGIKPLFPKHTKYQIWTWVLLILLVLLVLVYNKNLFGM